jgi:hypothetical protein
MACSPIGNEILVSGCLIAKHGEQQSGNETETHKNYAGRNKGAPFALSIGSAPFHSRESENLFEICSIAAKFSNYLGGDKVPDRPKRASKYQASQAGAVQR